MKVSIFSTKSYDRQFFTAANLQHQLTFLEPRLNQQTACLATNATAICVFVKDRVDKNTLELLADHGVKLVALRCAGYNNVDLPAAKTLGIKIVRTLSINSRDLSFSKCRCNHQNEASCNGD